MSAHRTTAELEAFLPTITQSPREIGSLELIVARTDVGQREVLSSGQLTQQQGLVGDNWHLRPSSKTADGGPHPLMQLNVMNSRVIEFLAIDPERRALAGDQLYLDLDLSHENLPAGTRLIFASGAVIEVTEEPHTGCAKFVERFGREAMKFVNGPTGRPLRLRGLNARVVTDGPISTGDEVRVARFTLD